MRPPLSADVLALAAGWLALACSAPGPTARPLPPSAAKPALVSARNQGASSRREAPASEALRSLAPQTSASAPTAKPALVRVEPDEVCMLSNRYLGGRKQVPVQVDGSTYYGCCARCAAHLGQRAPARTAIDPVTGHSVDKARAIIARDAHNAVLYFESEQTFARYGG